MNQNEIARKLNVSQGLISQVLNNPETNRIPEEKKKEILDFINAVGYKHVKKSKKDIRKIGYITCLHLEEYKNLCKSYIEEYKDLYKPYFSGVGEACKNYDLELSIKNYKPDQIGKFAKIENVEGYIAQSIHFGEFTPFLKKENTVFMDNPMPGFDSVIPDNRKTAYLAVEHFVSMGHSRIAFWFLWKSMKNVRRSFHQEDLLDGFHSAVRAFGLEDCSKLIYLPEAKKQTIEEIEELAGEMLQKWKSMKDAPTAVFTGDFYALTMIKVAEKLGISIPRDLSIIGFDNVQAGETSNPPLTTIEHNREEMGRLSIELLINRLKRPEAPPKTLICEPFLVERKSVSDIRK